MKRSEMLDIIARILDIPEVKVAGLEGPILRAIEEAGMLPPKIIIKTPLGPRIFFETHEWEEYAKYDDEGCPIK